MRDLPWTGEWDALSLVVGRDLVCVCVRARVRAREQVTHTRHTCLTRTPTHAASHRTTEPAAPVPSPDHPRDRDVLLLRGLRPGGLLLNLEQDGGGAQVVGPFYRYN